MADAPHLLEAPQLHSRHEDGRSWPTLLWTAPPGWRAVSSAIVGGGIGDCHWWINAMVRRNYDREDPAQHLAEIAAELGAGSGRGVGMLTAADVSAVSRGSDGDVVAYASVGISWPVWAAREAALCEAETATRVGTINTLVVVPVPLSDAALVNAVMTATEAKTQALMASGIPGTGTASDAVMIACPKVAGDGGPDLAQEVAYAGPRAPWGAAIARAVYSAVDSGTQEWIRQWGRPAEGG